MNQETVEAGIGSDGMIIPESVDRFFGRLNARAEQALGWANGHFRLLVVTSSVGVALVHVAVMCLVGASSALFIPTDGVAYFLKAREILAGDWTPILSHEIGWPVLMAPILALVGSLSVPGQFIALSVYSSLFAAVSVIPVSVLARKWFGRLWVIAWLFWLAMLLRRTKFFIALLTEPVFLPVFILAIIFVTGALSWRRAALSGALAGICSWIRPNGLFVLVIVLLLIGIQIWREEGLRTKRLLGLLLAAAAAWLLVIAPKSYGRIDAFGEVLSYGINSRYVAGSIARAWSTNQPDLGLVEYLVSSSPAEWFDRFVVRGVVPMTVLYLEGVGSRYLPHTILFFIGLAVCIFRRGPPGILVSHLVWLAGLSLVASTYPVARHWWPIRPFYVMCAALGLSMVTRSMKHRHLWASAVTALILIHGVGSLASSTVRHRAMAARQAVEPVSEWIVSNLTGKMGMHSTGSFFVPFDPGMKIGGRSFGFYRSERLETSLLPYTDDLATFFDLMERHDMTHLMLDSEPKWITPVEAKLFREGGIETGNLAVDFLDELYESYSLPGVWSTRVYRIDWGEYHRWRERARPKGDEGTG